MQALLRGDRDKLVGRCCGLGCPPSSSLRRRSLLVPAFRCFAYGPLRRHPGGSRDVWRPGGDRDRHVLAHACELFTFDGFRASDRASADLLGFSSFVPFGGGCARVAPDRFSSRAHLSDPGERCRGCRDRSRRLAYGFRLGRGWHRGFWRRSSRRSCITIHSFPAPSASCPPWCRSRPRRHGKCESQEALDGYALRATRSSSCWTSCRRSSPLCFGSASKSCGCCSLSASSSRTFRRTRSRASSPRAWGIRACALQFGGAASGSGRPTDGGTHFLQDLPKWSRFRSHLR